MVDGVIDGESEGGDCDEVMCAASQDEVNKEEREQDEVDGTKKGSDSTGKVLGDASKRAVGDL